MCWQHLPGLIVTGRSTIGADPCGLLSAPIAKLSSHCWVNTRSRSHEGLGAGIRDAWIARDTTRAAKYSLAIVSNSFRRDSFGLESRKASWYLRRVRPRR